MAPALSPGPRGSLPLTWVAIAALLSALGNLRPCAGLSSSVLAPLSPIAERGSARQRQECVAHTHPIFPMGGPDSPPNCRAWTCQEYADPTDPAMTCCLPRMSVWEAISMLNDTVIAFHGDSTAYRAANQLDAFLTGLPYMGFKHDMGFNHLAVNGNRTVQDGTGASTSLKVTWTSVRFVWAAHLRELPGSHSRAVAMFNNGLRSLNATRAPAKGKDVHGRYAHGVHARVGGAPLTEEEVANAIEGVPDRDMAVYGITPAKRHVVVLEAFSHDAISALTHVVMSKLSELRRPGQPPIRFLNMTEEIAERFLVNFRDAYVSRIVEAMELTQAQLHPDDDILILRGPIAHSYTAVSGLQCGGDVDFQNRAILNISMAVQEALRQRPDIRAMFLPTAEWTRAPDGSGVVGRHPCAPADEAGVHFDTGTANLAHIQQVLHAVALQAVDRPGWHDTHWYRARYLKGVQ